MKTRSECLSRVCSLSHEPVRRRQQVAGVAHQHPARPEHAEVQPDARRSRAAVERERDRPAGGVRAVDGVGDHEHLGLGLRAVELVVGVRLCPQHDAPCGRRVTEFLAVDGDRVRRRDQIVDRLLGRAVGLFAVAFGRRLPRSRDRRFCRLRRSRLACGLLVVGGADRLTSAIPAAQADPRSRLAAPCRPRSAHRTRPGLLRPPDATARLPRTRSRQARPPRWCRLRPTRSRSGASARRPMP